MQQVRRIRGHAAELCKRRRPSGRDRPVCVAFEAERTRHVDDLARSQRSFAAGSRAGRPIAQHRCMDRARVGSHAGGGAGEPLSLGAAVADGRYWLISNTVPSPFTPPLTVVP